MSVLWAGRVSKLKSDYPIYVQPLNSLFPAVQELKHHVIDVSGLIELQSISVVQPGLSLNSVFLLLLKKFSLFLYLRFREFRESFDTLMSQHSRPLRYINPSSTHRSVHKGRGKAVESLNKCFEFRLSINKEKYFLSEFTIL